MNVDMGRLRPDDGAVKEILDESEKT